MHKEAKFWREEEFDEIALDCTQKAWLLFKEIAPASSVACAADLRDEDFEKLVPLWSR